MWVISSETHYVEDRHDRHSVYKLFRMLSKTRVGPGAFAVSDNGLSLLHDFDRDHVLSVWVFLFFRRDFLPATTRTDNSFFRSVNIRSKEKERKSASKILNQEVFSFLTRRVVLSDGLSSLL